MNATRSVDNDSGVGHKNRASQCDFICFNMKPLTLEYTAPQPDKEYFLGVWFPEGSANAILSGYVDDQNIQFYIGFSGFLNLILSPIVFHQEALF